MFKRLFQAVVFFFAVYAFVFVPLGQKTALEHVRAIAGTPAAKTAASELSGGVKRLAHELRNEARRVTEAADEQMAGEEDAVELERPAKPVREPRSTARDEEKPRKAAPRLVREPAAASSASNGSGD